MNIKLSQLPLELELQNDYTFPILKDGENYITSIGAIYQFLSGDNIIDVYTSYSSNSASIQEGHNVYSSYSQASSNFVKADSQDVINWNNTYINVRDNINSWNNVTTKIQDVSGRFILSDSAVVPGASAIKNIVAITQTAYDQLTIIEPDTFYVIAS
jgi:hypothetical protein